MNEEMKKYKADFEDLELGKVVDFEGVKLKVEKADSDISCERCFFEGQCPKSPFKCIWSFRQDKTSVVFVKVTEGDEEKNE